MARLDCGVYFEDVALTADAWVTVASLKAPANQMLALKRVKICGEGVAGDAKPLGVRVSRVTADSGTGTAATPRRLNNALTASPQATARTTFTVEPTTAPAGEYLFAGKFHPQGGTVDELVLGEVLVKEGTETAVQVKLPAGQSVINVSGHVNYEE